MRAIDLNSDLGEGAGADEEVMKHVTSANVACGAHAGDEAMMRRTVRLALEKGVAVGAHPGYPDREGFGRIAMRMEKADLIAEIVRQLEALSAIATEEGARLAHVKAHGALYNQGERDVDVAGAIVEAARSFDGDLLLFAPPGSALESEARRIGLRVAREGFADRAYEPDGTLRSRKLPGAVHTDPAAAAKQALELAARVDTICIHGDTPGAMRIAAEVRSSLARAGFDVRAPSPP